MSGHRPGRETITICSAARTITLRILGDEMGRVRRGNVILTEHGTPGSGIPGWRYDAAAGIIEMDFTLRRTTVIKY